MFFVSIRCQSIRAEKTYELFVAVKYSAGNHPLNTFLLIFTNTSGFFQQILNRYEPYKRADVKTYAASCGKQYNFITKSKGCRVLIQAEHTLSWHRLCFTVIGQLFAKCSQQRHHLQLQQVYNKGHGDQWFNFVLLSYEPIVCYLLLAFYKFTITFSVMYSWSFWLLNLQSFWAIQWH